MLKKRFVILCNLAIGCTSNVFCQSDCKNLTSTDEQELTYSVNILGLSTSQLAELQDEKLTKNQNLPVNNLYALKDRVANFASSVKTRLIMSGYYDANVKYEIDDSHQNGQKINITINVELGKIYTISDIKFKFLDADNIDHQANLDKLISDKRFIKSKISSKASALNVTEIAQWLTRALHKRGYPFAKVSSQNVFIHRNEPFVDVILDVNLGKKLSFGETKIEGLDKVSEKFVSNRIYWQTGDLFDIRNIERTKHSLSSTQLFSSIDVKINDSEVNDKLAPVKIILQEDKPRSLELSLFYSTTKNYNFQKVTQSQKKLRSVYGALTWTHYNFAGNGEKMKIRASGAPFSVINNAGNSRDYELLAEYTKPDTFFPRDSFITSICHDRQNKNAYYKLGKSIGFMWDSPFFIPDLKVQFGGTFEENSVNGPNEIFDNYKAITSPIIVIYDKRNSILNPTKGYKFSLKFDPQFLLNRKIIYFAKLYGTYVHSLKNDKTAVFACWMNLSKLFVGNENTLPLDKRLYAGGMSSVRGYGTQMAGPMHKTKDNEDTEFPYGGASCLEFGLELRKKIYKNISAVTFFESASVGKKSKWYSGYGIGIRYNTLIGPVRMDLAFPLKRRKKIDSKMQFYLSFGQAF